MGNLFGALLSTASSLDIQQRRLNVIQNNVANASTPGFVKQRLSISAKAFDIRSGLPGGVQSGSLISVRDEYSERSVWKQESALGRFSQQASDLAQIEPVFNIAQGAGLPAALNSFFDSVSSLTINPNDPVSRQVVLDRADALGRSFRENATSLTETTASVNRQLSTTVDKINTLAGRVRDLNAELRSDRRKLEDPSIDAKIHETFDELATLVDFSTVRQDDGSYQLLLGGQTALVIGDHLYKIQADFSNPQVELRDAAGNLITGQPNQGTLKSLLDTTNTVIPSYLSDLNRLAQTFADRVNETLAGGVDANGTSPTLDLFTYDPTVGAALTIQTNTLTTDQLAAALPGAEGGNGNAILLSKLSKSAGVGGATFSEFYGQLGARVGRDLQNAQNGQDLQEQLSTQARVLRDQASGISLDEQAAALVEVQKAYQANARLFAVINEMTNTLIDLLK